MYHVDSAQIATTAAAEAAQGFETRHFHGQGKSFPALRALFLSASRSPFSQALTCLVTLGRSLDPV